MSGKRLAFLQRLLDQVKHPDQNLASDIAKGFHLAGWSKASGVFPPAVTPPSFAEEDLRESSKWTRPSIISSVKSSGDPAADLQLWEETMLEAQKGWLIPVSQEAVPYTHRTLPTILRW